MGVQNSLDQSGGSSSLIEAGKPACEWCGSHSMSLWLMRLTSVLAVWIMEFVEDRPPPLCFTVSLGAMEIVKIMPTKIIEESVTIITIIMFVLCLRW